MFCAPPVKVRAARKPHRCTWCGEVIEVGQPYERWMSVDDFMQTNKAHPECVIAMNRLAKEEGGTTEFEPGSFKRGSTEDR